MIDDALTQVRSELTRRRGKIRSVAQQRLASADDTGTGQMSATNQWRNIVIASAASKLASLFVNHCC